jgi:hypothetical protein
MDERLVPFGLADIAKAFEDQQCLPDANAASGSPWHPRTNSVEGGRRAAWFFVVPIQQLRAAPDDRDIGRIDAIDRVRIGVVRLTHLRRSKSYGRKLAKPSTATIIASFQTLLTLLNQVIRLSPDPAI